MILWLASYPKSGNTWIRLLISNYLYPKNNSIFESLDKILRFPNYDQFSDFIKKDELKDDENKILKYYIIAQDKINLNNKLNILKTHNFCGEINGYSFTNKDNTCGSIYVVRDPRSVTVSRSYHNQISLEESVDSILDENRVGINDNFITEYHLSWKINYLSWINSPYPKLLIKYEDLFKDTFGELKKILEFINKFQKIEINKKKIEETITNCNFQNLRKLEKTIGFKEKKR